jgi:nicotinamide-nucleotide amidase
MKRVGIVCTGDELIQGQVIDTNAPYIAELCVKNNLVCGERVTVDDNEKNLQRAMRYQLANHEVVICIGGLGPTSDDRTRFALGEVLKLPLLEHEESISRIQARLASVGLKFKENNRQQALFPEHAYIIANAHGTADACEIRFDDKLIYLLPGPPNECRPIFVDTVLPRILDFIKPEKMYRQHWLLFNTAESDLAVIVDPLVQADVDIGYRYNYPYIELKLASLNQASFTKVKAEIENKVANYIISHENISLEQQCRNLILKLQTSLLINDSATGGMLQHSLLTPATQSYLTFTSGEADITISGLKAYWDQRDEKLTDLHIHHDDNHEIIRCKHLDDRVLKYACAASCQFIMKMLGERNGSW